MKVHANIRQEVEVNPIDVIQELINEELGNWRNWIFERDGNYYIGFEVSMGQHSMDDETGITKEKYDYIKSLEQIKEYLQKKSAKL